MDDRAHHAPDGFPGDVPDGSSDDEEPGFWATARHFVTHTWIAWLAGGALYAVGLTTGDWTGQVLGLLLVVASVLSWTWRRS